MSARCSGADGQGEVGLLAQLGQAAVGAPQVEVGVAQPQQDGVPVRHVQRPLRHPERDQQADEGMGDDGVAPVEEAVPPVADEHVRVVQVVVLQRGRDAEVRQARARLARSGPGRRRPGRAPRRSARRGGRGGGTSSSASRSPTRPGSRSSRASGTPRSTISSTRGDQVELQPGVVAQHRLPGLDGSRPPAARSVAAAVRQQHQPSSRMHRERREHVRRAPTPPARRRAAARGPTPGRPTSARPRRRRTGSRSAVDHGADVRLLGLAVERQAPARPAPSAAHSRAPARQRGSCHVEMPVVSSVLTRRR